MKLYIITNQTRTSVTQAVCTLHELNASQFADVRHDVQAVLAYEAALHLERNPSRQFEASVLLAFPVGGAQ